MPVQFFGMFISLIFEWTWSKLGMAIYSVYKTIKSAVSEEWVYELDWFLHADCDAMIFC